MNDSHHIPLRSQVPQEDTWDLSRLFPNDPAWEEGLKELDALLPELEQFKGSLSQSISRFADYLDYSQKVQLLLERLAYYSELRSTEDEGDSQARAMAGKFAMVYSRAAAADSWAAPEILSLPDETIQDYLQNPRVQDYRVNLEKLIRQKAHVLSDKEERLLAMMREAEDTPQEAFSVLTNVDFDFGDLDTPEGKRPLSQSTYAVFMENPDREIRKQAYFRLYSSYESHKTTLASLYSGAVKQNVIQARIRGYSSARAMALFPDRVDEGVYDNLISAVNANLLPLHRYYSLRKKQLHLPELRHYDVYVPLVGDVKRNTSYQEAVDLVSQALAPLGSAYVDTLRSGLLGRWVDRYENKGKRSGAFSAGSYRGDPYILLNYKEDAIRDVFTLAHEGGHSMHSWYSARNNPFSCYNYSIFEAEVASTFNEELLYRRLLRDAKEKGDKSLQAYLVNKRCDDLLATLYRQTMFAEFEHKTHQAQEQGIPLTVDFLRAEYRKLLEKYFGDEMVLEEQSDMEGLRIPHFYSAFYVYKYSTGVSASLALAERVLSGSQKEKDDYFRFLKSGGSRYPMDSLKLAGVDMSTPAPVEAACAVFSGLVDELEQLLSKA